MSLLKNIFKKDEQKQPRVFDISLVQNHFGNFLKILELNNNMMKLISDLEEKSRGEYLFDMEFIKKSLTRLDENVLEIITALNEMSNQRYSGLFNAYHRICNDIHGSLPGEIKIVQDKGVIPFSQLDRSLSRQVGSKCANLGELRNKVGLPVPDGFSISAYGYLLLLENSGLRELIQSKMASIDLKKYDMLAQTSEQIRAIIKKNELPKELKAKIDAAVLELGHDGGDFYSVRSSALGEDTQFSFAGQYASYLNVRKEQVIDCYKDVLASQFSPRAIYYYLCQGMHENELAMSVVCMKMIRACSAGVIYTVNPIDPEKNVLLINSVWGLGKLVVDGTVTPDCYVVDKNSGKIISQQIAKKPIKLIAKEGGGIERQNVASENQESPSLLEDQAKQLAEFALKIENHYGEPQDIEWAIDETGAVFLLQARPLRVSQKPKIKTEQNLSGNTLLYIGGITAACGVGGGKVFHLRNENALTLCPDGAVIVAHSPFPSLVMIMSRVNAIITEVGGITGHMATVAREFRIPTLMNVADAFQIIPENSAITVDADNRSIYKGIVHELISDRSPEQNIFEDTALFVTLERLLKKIVPLHLISPRSSDFVAESCRTYHDITRFAHQKALYEMFQVVEISKSDMAAAPSLRTAIPLPIRILFIDSQNSHLNVQREISEDDIPSVPMQAFWSGIKHAGWPRPPSVSVKGFASVLATSMSTGAAARSTFSENSFALLSNEYMNFSIRMGYHYSTIEALCTEAAQKNYIRMKFQEGGASLERRRRRVKLIINILQDIGFENFSKGDFLDSSIAYCDKSELLHKLKWLGALSIYTKQLDMTLSSDGLMRWYEDDIRKKLNEL